MQSKWTVTLVLFQPLALGCGLRLPLICGFVLSMLMPPTVAEEATFPALSTQTPLLVTDWPAPSPVTVSPGDGVGRDARLNGARVGAGEGDGHVGVIPAVSVGLGTAAAADLRVGLVDVDAADCFGRGGVAGVVYADAAVGDGLACALGGDGVPGDGVASDAGLNGACVGAGEGDRDVGVVPAIGVRLVDRGCR